MGINFALKPYSGNFLLNYEQLVTHCAQPGIRGTVLNGHKEWSFITTMLQQLHIWLLANGFNTVYYPELN